MHKGALRLGVFNSACVTWLPKIVPGFRAAFPGIDVQIYQGSYDDITGWLKTGAVELGFLSNSSAHDLDFEPLYDDRLICIAPPGYQPRRPGVVRAEELRSQPFVSQQSDVDADIQSYFKKNDLHVSSRCYIVDDQSMIAMVACGQGLALMPELMFKEGAASAGCLGFAAGARRQAHDWSGVPVADSAPPPPPGNLWSTRGRLQGSGDPRGRGRTSPGPQVYGIALVSFIVLRYGHIRVLVGEGRGAGSACTRAWPRPRSCCRRRPRRRYAHP